MAMAKEPIRQIISQNDINSVIDVYFLLKESKRYNTRPSIHYEFLR